MNSVVVLMIEAEQPEGLSARKLIVEAAKHNVITAYSADTGLDLIHRFPNVDLVFVHESLLKETPELLSEVRKHCQDTPIVLGSPYGNVTSPIADYVVDSYRPNDLLKLLLSEFGESRG